MRPPCPNRPSLLRSHAFSLIEVALALGIVSFALLGMLGLLPIGLVAIREAMSQTACAHIIQKTAGDLEMISSPDDLEDYIKQPKYFDDSGSSLEGGALSSAVFVASLSPEAPEYPGSARLDGLSSQVTRVVVTVFRYVPGSSPEAANRLFRTSLSLTKSK